MKCFQCGLHDTVDCIVFLPGMNTCARCGAEMTEEQIKEARKFYPWGNEIPEKNSS